MGPEHFIVSCGGAVIDRIVGDPEPLPHPVVGIGQLISFLETRLNRPGRSRIPARLWGALTVLTVLAVAYGATWGILKLAAPIPWLFWPLQLWLMGTTIAWKGLRRAGLDIFQSLTGDDLAKARRQVGMIVGRDTTDLPKPELIRATVESVAENTVDGVIAPLLFGLAGGAPLAMAYRAVNTLDSMLGYKNERYLHFGWAAARLDDAANWIPARVAALLMALAAWLMRMDGARALRIAWRDAHKHPSPNGGWPEAVVAGALGVRLGGFNRYHGVISFREHLGDPVREFEERQILTTIRILDGAALLLVAFLLLGSLLF